MWCVKDLDGFSGLAIEDLESREADAVKSVVPVDHFATHR